MVKYSRATADDWLLSGTDVRDGPDRNDIRPRRRRPRDEKAGIGPKSWLWLGLLAAALVIGAPRGAAALYLDDDAGQWGNGRSASEIDQNVDLPVNTAFIPVCWDPDLDPNSEIAMKIQEAVESTWAFFANITFEGWGNCPVADPKDMPHGAYYLYPGDGRRPVEPIRPRM